MKKYCEDTREEDLTSDGIKQDFLKGMKDKTTILKIKLRKMTSVANVIYGDWILQEEYTINISE